MHIQTVVSLSNSNTKKTVSKHFPFLFTFQFLLSKTSDISILHTGCLWKLRTHTLSIRDISNTEFQSTSDIKENSLKTSPIFI